MKPSKLLKNKNSCPFTQNKTWDKSSVESVNPSKKENNGGESNIDGKYVERKIGSTS